MKGKKTYFRNSKMKKKSVMAGGNIMAESLVFFNN